MLIHYQDIKKNTLIALIEEFIDREGTDYGEYDVSRESMIAQVLQQLNDDKVFICYDADTESCNIITALKASSIGENFN